MARPNSNAIPAFTHDVDMSNDQKIRLLQCWNDNPRDGMIAYAVYNKFLEMIYANSYYIELTKPIRMLFCRDSGLTDQELESILQACAEFGLFDKRIFDTYAVLTSISIQERWLKYVTSTKFYKKKELRLHRKYTLFDPETIAKDVPENIIIYLDGVIYTNNGVNHTNNHDNHTNNTINKINLNQPKLNKIKSTKNQQKESQLNQPEPSEAVKTVDGLTVDGLRPKDEKHLTADQRNSSDNIFDILKNNGTRDAKKLRDLCNGYAVGIPPALIESAIEIYRDVGGTPGYLRKSLDNHLDGVRKIGDHNKRSP